MFYKLLSMKVWNSVMSNSSFLSLDNLYGLVTSMSLHLFDVGILDILGSKWKSSERSMKSELEILTINYEDSLASSTIIGRLLLNSKIWDGMIGLIRKLDYLFSFFGSFCLNFRSVVYKIVLILILLSEIDSI